MFSSSATVDEHALIEKLIAQFFQLEDPRDLDLPSGNLIVQPAVQRAIYEHMFNETALWPVPPASYRTRVLKMILSRIEESISNPEEDEILDDLMECWGELVAQPKLSSLEQVQQLAYIKYAAPYHCNPEDNNNNNNTQQRRTIITSESRGLILSSGTTGFRTWEAALHLGTFLSSTPAGEALVRGKKVVELGAGTGFLSMFCAKHLGVHSVVVTDRAPALIGSIQDCVARNQIDSGIVFPVIWEWGSPLECGSLLHGEGEDEGEGGSRSGSGSLEFDVALGADLIYDVDLVPLLISTLHDLFTNYKVKEFIISATLRNQDTFRTFLDACETNNFKVDCLPFESPKEAVQTGFFHSTGIPIRTYRITR